MKKLMLALLLSPLFSFAQAIPEKANQIIVVNEETAYANFIDVKLLLSKKGIDLASQDKETFQVKSGLIDIKGSGSSYYIFTCRDNKITINGKVNYISGNNTADEFVTITNIGTKDTSTKLSFEAMNAFAKHLGTKLKYEVVKE